MAEINCKQGQSCTSVQRPYAPGTPITAQETGRFYSTIAAGIGASPATVHTHPTALSFPGASHPTAACIGPAWPSTPQGN